MKPVEMENCTQRVVHSVEATSAEAYEPTLKNLLYRLEHENPASAITAAERIGEIGIPDKSIFDVLTKLIRKAGDESVRNAIKETVQKLEGKTSQKG
jgi:hypothetical protein